jgi:hypothetical protein
LPKRPHIANRQKDSPKADKKSSISREEVKQNTRERQESTGNVPPKPKFSLEEEGKEN